MSICGANSIDTSERVPEPGSGCRVPAWRKVVPPGTWEESEEPGTAEREEEATVDPASAQTFYSPPQGRLTSF